MDEKMKGVADEICENAQMLDIPGQAVIGTTLEGKIVYWSASAENLYGWSRSEVLGRDVLDVTPSLLSVEMAGRIMKELAAGRTWTGEFRVRHRDGRDLVAHVQDVPVRDRNGNLIGIVGISAAVE